jgi:hypothetical protein
MAVVVLRQNKDTCEQLLTKQRAQVDLNKIVSELKSERDRIARAIAALLDEAKVAVGASTRKVAGSTRRGKGLTPAGRRRLSQAMKQRWAARRGKGAATKVAATKVAARKRRGGITAAGRKKLSEAMKRRWAERKKSAS